MVITNEILALLICWAVGIIMSRLEKQEACNKEEVKPSEQSVLGRLAMTSEEQQARLDALRIVAQERLKGLQNGNRK